MESLIVAPNTECGHSRDGAHRGQWSVCNCTVLEGCDTHRTTFICRLCGERFIVVTVHLTPGQMTPLWVPE